MHFSGYISLKTSNICAPKRNRYSCQRSISYNVKSELLHRKWLTTYKVRAHCTKGSSSRGGGGRLDKPIRHTHRNGTDSLRIFPIMPAWLYCGLHRNGWCEDSRAPQGSVVYLKLAVPIRRDGEEEDTRLRTVLDKSQNGRMTPRSSTRNLSKVKILYKLHGANPKQANTDNTGSNSSALWAIR